MDVRFGGAGRVEGGGPRLRLGRLPLQGGVVKIVVRGAVEKLYTGALVS